MQYSVHEIINMAIEIEQNGYYFYTKCAEKFNEPSKHELFTMLAEEELVHKKTFASMLVDAKETTGEFDDQYYMYLNALTKEQLFTNTDEIDSFLKGVENINDVFKIALHTEKDSIMWYRELKDMYDENDVETITTLNRLIAEEKKHIVMIFNLMHP